MDRIRLPDTAVHRLLQTAIAMVVVALAIRLAWGWSLSRQVTHRIEALRAQGKPISLADYVEHDVDPVDDAWSYIVQAAGARGAKQ